MLPFQYAMLQSLNFSQFPIATINIYAVYFSDRDLNKSFRGRAKRRDYRDKYVRDSNGKTKQKIRVYYFSKKKNAREELLLI